MTEVVFLPVARDRCAGSEYIDHGRVLMEAMLSRWPLPLSRAAAEALVFPAEARPSPAGMAHLLALAVQQANRELWARRPGWEIVRDHATRGWRLENVEAHEP